MAKKNSSNKKKSHSTVSHQSLTAGVLDVAKSGIGYVIMPDGKGDILVRQNDMLNALHGDTVRVKIVKENLISGRKEGRIIELVNRKQTNFVGTIQLSRGFAFFIADSEKPMPNFYIPNHAINGAVDGARVMVNLVKWDKDDKKPVGEIVGILNPEDENDVAMKRLLLEAGFPLQFPDDVMEEAARIPDEIPEIEETKRRDCREILTFTIDPVDAKDFDDAISIQQLKNGVYEIGVHIADVSHYVKPDTALDTEAYERATSVYLPDRVNPMLPEHISNVLCSLRPNEDKCTFSIIFQINTDAKVLGYWIGKTLMHSDHRFTYEEVQEIIETERGEYVEEVLLLNTMAKALRKARFDKGAINFSSQEVRFKLDERGKPIGIMVKESKESHQLIEEFMLLANRTVAAFVSKEKVNDKPIPFPYRVHDSPDEKKLAPFVAFARKFGYTFDASSPDKIAESFNALTLAAKGKPEQQVLEQLGIRTMAKAVYTTENIGHYGLAFEDYCHFTSPIRRYPDVQVHRIVESILKGKAVVDKKLEEKCKHTSDRERAAMECERASNKYKQVEYMRNYLGHTFEAVITGVSNYGFWAETIAHKCEGMVSVTGLNLHDEFRLVEEDFSLVGRRSGRAFRMGDKLFVKVVAANLEKRQLEYDWVPNNLVEIDAAAEERATPKKEKVIEKAVITEDDKATKKKKSRNTPKPKTNNKAKL